MEKLEQIAELARQGYLAGEIDTITASRIVEIVEDFRGIQELSDIVNNPNEQ